MSSSIAPSGPVYRFDAFRLDLPNRQLWQGEERIDLNARYFDALALLVREHGQLVEKDRLFEDVWGDVVVSDSALTQCIKELRKTLGDDASNPRYILTVPRYGYRFIGPVEADSAPRPAPEATRLPAPTAPPDEALAAVPLRLPAVRTFLQQSGAGLLGGAIAGVFGGLLYGFGLAYTPADSGIGTASVLAVLISLNVFVGAMGGLGVSLGMAAPALAALRGTGWRIFGAALGGLLVGTTAKLLGVDAFNLFFGHAPAGITGGLEGAALGAALALGISLGGGLDATSGRRPVIGAGLAGAAAGVLITLSGGRLMGGSLDLLAQSFSGSRLRLDALGRFVGELHFSDTAQMALGGLEGLLFGCCVASALVLMRGKFGE